MAIQKRLIALQGFRLFFCKLNPGKSMKYFFAVLVFSSQVAAAQFTTHVYWTEQSTLPASDVIYFSHAQPLQWAHFKGKPDAESPAAALTASGFGYKADLKVKGGKGDLNVGVYCFFNKNNSWVKPGKTTAYILAHEQNHFNISYLAAWVFVNKLKTTPLNQDNYNQELARMYQESCDYMNKMQKDYDSQTRNGQLPAIQARWQDQIGEMMINLKPLQQ